jgi:uncharacterized membrane protein YjdF
MKKGGEFVILGVFALSVLVFGTTFFVQHNYEFIQYQLTIVGYGIALYFLNRTFHFPHKILWSMLLLACLHMLGGVNFGFGLIYGWMIYPLGPEFLRYDQIVHVFGTFTIALLFHHVLRRSLKQDGIAPHVILALCALGVGAYVEMTEFFVALGIPDNFVGDYRNFALDLIADAVGAVAAMTVMYLREQK